MEEKTYTWEQVIGYAVISLHNLIESKKEITLENLVSQLYPLQTLYGKEGIASVGKRYLENERK